MHVVQQVPLSETLNLSVTLPSDRWSATVDPNLSTKDVTVVRCVEKNGTPVICIGLHFVDGNWRFVLGHTTRNVQLHGTVVLPKRGITLCLDDSHPSGVVTAC